jgi:CelD/BcsL family acetyltransferase involved in cellulose biosynthesis
MKELIREDIENQQAGSQEQSITVQVIKGADSISEFSKEWDDLFDRAVDATPYLSRFWVSAFIREGRLRGTALFILAWHGAELAGLFPLAVRECMYGKTAEPIGTSVPSYLGLLVDPNFPEVAACIARAFQKEKIARFIQIEDLWSVDKATNVFFDELQKRHFSVGRVCRNPCLMIQLDCSYEDYLLNNKSGMSRKTLRKKERKLNRQHDIRIKRYHNSEITDAIIDRIASIQEQSWMKRRGAVIFTQPFYRKLLLAMAQGGFARAWLMTLDGDDAAFAVAFYAHRKLHYAWIAFKLKYTSVSVGQLLTAHVIEDACGDGIVWFDFSHGDAEYKRFWSTDAHRVCRVAAGRGILGRILCVWYCILWRLLEVQWVRMSYRRLKNVVRSLKHKKTRT